MIRSFVLFMCALAFIGCTDQKPDEGQHGLSIDSGATKGSRDLGKLRDSISDYISAQPAEIGVAIHSIEDGDTLSVNGDRPYPLMSVAKVPQAIALLHLVDEGKISMSEPVQLTAADLSQRTASSLRKDHPGQSITLSITEALRYMIGQSDNITSNKVFEMEGGPAAVTQYLQSIGVEGTTLSTNYRKGEADLIANNRGTPRSMALLLKKFYADGILSDSSRLLLWNLMEESVPGADRIKGQLPAATVVAHKTGTGGTNAEGVISALNDIGIIRLPNGKHVAIAVLVANSRASMEQTAKIIATLSRMVWDEFVR